MRVEVGERAAGKHREPAVQTPLYAKQQSSEAIVDTDRLGLGRNLDDGPVKVEE